VTNNNAVAGERQWTEYLLTFLVIVGIVCFTYFEFLIWSFEAKSLYCSDERNISQQITRLLTVFFVILEYSNVSRALVAHFAAMVMLCNMSMILFFLRGFDQIACIIHALFSIWQEMIPFLIAMFVILFMFALTYWILYGTGAAIDVCDDPDITHCGSRNFDGIGRSLQTTIYAGIFEDFDLDSM